MTKPTITETHTRKAVATFSQADIQMILGKIVAEAAGIPLETDGLTLTMRFEDETAGNPPYRTGHRARVQIELDLTKVAGGEA